MVSKSSLNLLIPVNLNKIMVTSWSAAYGNEMKWLQCLRIMYVDRANLSTHLPSKCQQTCHNPFFTFRGWMVWNLSCATSLKLSSCQLAKSFLTMLRVKVRLEQENASMSRLCARLWMILVLMSVYLLLKVWVWLEMPKPICRWQCLRTFTWPARWLTWRSTLTTHSAPILAAWLLVKRSRRIYISTVARISGRRLSAKKDFS